MTNLDKLLHEVSEVISTKILFNDCPKGLYKDYEYYDCENCLYLVRNKKNKMMLFIDAYSPQEAIETVMKIINEVEV